MSYTEEMWKNYCDIVLKMYTQGYRVEEIARAMESQYELVAKVIEQYWGGMGKAPDSSEQRHTVKELEISIVTLYNQVTGINGPS